MSLHTKGARAGAWMRRIAFSCVICFTIPAPAANAAEQASACGAIYFDIAKVRGAARNPFSDLVLLTPHRGLWRNAPENTLAAIEAARCAGFESVEIDVRLSGEGTPWLMHDYALDRLTSRRGYLSTYQDSTLKTAFVKDRYGEKTTTRIVPFTDVLGKLATDLRYNANTDQLSGYLLVVDLKSPPSDDPNKLSASGYEALKAAVLKMRNFGTEKPLNYAIVYKMKAKEFPVDPSDLEKALNITRDYPVFLMAVMHPDNAADGNRVLQNYASKPYMIGFEAVIEYPGQPIATQWIADLVQQGRTVPGFPGWNDYPEGVSNSNAYCCVYRRTLYDPSRPTFKPDYSGSFEFQLQMGANWLTADTVEFLSAYLTARGLRNTQRLMP